MSGAWRYHTDEFCRRVWQWYASVGAPEPAASLGACSRAAAVVLPLLTGTPDAAHAVSRASEAPPAAYAVGDAAPLPGDLHGASTALLAAPVGMPVGTVWLNPVGPFDVPGQSIGDLKAGQGWAKEELEAAKGADKGDDKETPKPAAVPEPSTLALLAVGVAFILAGIALRRP